MSKHFWWSTRLRMKERVHGLIVRNKTKVYRINSFPERIHTINDHFNNVPVVAAGSRSKNFVVTYERTLSDGTVLTFQPLQEALSAVMVDDEGTTWDLFGRGIKGPRAGAQLTPTRSYIAYWFAWAAFSPGAEIHSPAL